MCALHGPVTSYQGKVIYKLLVPEPCCFSAAKFGPADVDAWRCRLLWGAVG